MRVTDIHRKENISRSLLLCLPLAVFAGCFTPFRTGEPFLSTKCTRAGLNHGSGKNFFIPSLTLFLIDQGINLTTDVVCLVSSFTVAPLTDILFYPCDFYLQRHGTLFIVKNQSGDPVPNVHVWIKYWYGGKHGFSQWVHGSTDSDGRLLLDRNLFFCEVYQINIRLPTEEPRAIENVREVMKNKTDEGEIILTVSQTQKDP